MANLRTPYESIVCEERIGLSDKQWYLKRMADLSAKNPNLGVDKILEMLQNEKETTIEDIRNMGLSENVAPSEADIKKVLFLIIDPQFDFEPNGNLAVPGSIEDMQRLLRFAYRNLDKITRFEISLDTHSLFHVFSDCCWKDKDGNYVAPYTTITEEMVDAGECYPVMYPSTYIQYVKGLKEKSKQQLVIWTPHCLEFTPGWLPEQQLVRMIYFHEAARKNRAKAIQKGQSPFSEMYGIFKEEYPKGGIPKVNTAAINEIFNYDMILVAGQAKSHCVLESLIQLLETYKDMPEITSKVYFLMDCCSCIPGYEQTTEDKLKELQRDYNINLVNSTDLQL